MLADPTAARTRTPKVMPQKPQQGQLGSGIQHMEKIVAHGLFWLEWQNTQGEDREKPSYEVE